MSDSARRPPSRRGLLRGALAGGALAGTGLAALTPRRAYAGPLSGTLSTNQTYKVLEIFLAGGADMWQHFYRVASWDQDATWISPDGMDTISAADWSNLWAPCANSNWVPASPTTSITFGYSGSDTVLWGAAMKPLWMNGAAYQSRMVLVGHEFPPHEGGVPLALTGTSLGRPIGAALGTAVNRNRASGTAPVSFVFPVRNSGIPGYIVQAASSVGFHGAANRPVVIACGNDDIFAQLDRDTPSGGSTVARSDGDTLRTFYNSQYRGMLYRGGRTRSRAYDAYEGSLTTLQDHNDVLSRLSSPGLTFVNPGTNTIADNPTATAVRAACSVLGAGAEHAMVVDIDWDTHENGLGGTSPAAYALYNAKKVAWLTHALAEAMDNGTLDLNTTLVYIHSEFGRVHEGANGGQHHPDGYPVFLMGGPIVTPGVAGTLSPTGSYPIADGDYGVAAVRAAVALAAGVDPWHADMYSESDEWLGNVLSGYLGNLSAGNIPVLEQAILGMP